MIRKSPRSDCAAAGFTVLEVIVAFVVIALTLAAVMEIFSGGFRNTVTARAYRDALSRAESELARVGLAVPLEEGIRTGTFGDGASWRRVIMPYTDETLDTAGPAGLRAFTVEVTVFLGPDRDGDPRAVTLRTLRLADGP
ncbi:MAG: hypothetical protein ACFB6R_06825 [Alphaproteobacteria bacterium]